MKNIAFIVTIAFSVIGFLSIVKEIKDEKNNNIRVFLIFIAAVLFFPLIVFYLDYTNIGNYISLDRLISKEAWLGFVGTYVSGISAALLSSYVIILMTNKQIERQSIETYRPRLMQNSFMVLTYNDIKDLYVYNVTSFKSNNFDNNKCKDIVVNITLKNIGVGLAQDIRFFDLCNGNECVRTLFMNNNACQKLFSTEEIGIGNELDFNFVMKYYIDKNKEGIEKHDCTGIICVYRDINGHLYKMYIGIRVKNEIEKDEVIIPIIDVFYYQENTDSYQRIMQDNKENYDKIKKAILLLE